MILQKTDKKIKGYEKSNIKAIMLAKKLYSMSDKIDNKQLKEKKITEKLNNEIDNILKKINMEYNFNDVEKLNICYGASVIDGKIIIADYLSALNRFKVLNEIKEWLEKNKENLIKLDLQENLNSYEEAIGTTIKLRQYAKQRGLEYDDIKFKFKHESWDYECPLCQFVLGECKNCLWTKFTGYACYDNNKHNYNYHDNDESITRLKEWRKKLKEVSNEKN